MKAEAASPTADRSLTGCWTSWISNINRGGRHGQRCGQSLSHFLNPDGLRWIGYYSRSLLELSPYHEAFTKKLATYWTMVGIIAGEKGSPARATPNTILDFCGEDINWRNPGHAVDAFFKALDRLLEIGVISDARSPIVNVRNGSPKHMKAPGKAAVEGWKTKFT